MEHVELARELFSRNFNCAQSVFAAFAEDYGLSQEMALKLASGFGGGVRCGEVCGAASGAVLVIGLKNGHSKLGDMETKEFCNSETVEFMREFKKVRGSCVCREILGIDISVGDNRLKAKEMNLFNTVCVDMVTRAVEILEDMGY
jgi:C_GCAxxG_C_C family probable redox protein